MATRMGSTWGMAMILAAGLALAAAGPARAADEDWIQTAGPGGGVVAALVYSPADLNLVWAGAGTGLYRSENGGSTWTRTGLPTFGVTGVLPHPTDRQTAWAWGVTDRSSGWDGSFPIYSVYRTRDGGVHWTLLSSSFLEFRMHVTFALDPSDPNVLYATGYYGDWRNQGVVARSGDGGNTWVGLETNPGYFYEMSVDPLDSDRIFAFTPGNSLYRSIDAGRTWIPCNPAQYSLPPGSLITNIAATWAWAELPTVGHRRIRTGARGDRSGTPVEGVIFSDDGGDHWQWMDGWSTPSGTRAVRLHSADLNVGYVQAALPVFGGYGRFDLLRTEDGGANWQSISAPLPLLRGLGVLAPHPRDSASALYAAVDDIAGGMAVYRTSDGGRHWDRSDYGLASATVLCLSVDPADPRSVLAGTRRGIYRTVDAGAHWSPVGPALVNIFAMATRPSHSPTEVYAAAYRQSNGVEVEINGFFRSTDGGQSWEALPSVQLPWAGYVAQALALDSDDPATIYLAGTDDPGLLRLPGNRASWQYPGVPYNRRGGSGRKLALAAARQGTVFCAGNQRGSDYGNDTIFRSVDAGTTWTAVRTNYAGGYWSIAASPNLDVVWAGGTYEIARSTDGGTTWTATAATGGYAIPVIAPDPANRDHALAIVSLTWNASLGTLIEWNGTDWLGSLGEVGASDVAFAPSDSRYVYVATRGRGVLRSKAPDEPIDLHAVALRIDGGRHAPGEDLTLHLEVRNESLAASPLSRAQAYLSAQPDPVIAPDDIQLGATFDIPAMPEQGQVSVTRTVRFPILSESQLPVDGSPLYLKVRVTADGDPADQNSANDVAVAELNLPSRTDPVPGPPSTAPAPPTGPVAPIAPIAPLIPPTPGGAASPAPVAPAEPAAPVVSAPASGTGGASSPAEALAPNTGSTLVIGVPMTGGATSSAGASSGGNSTGVIGPSAQATSSSSALSASQHPGTPEAVGGAAPPPLPAGAMPAVAGSSAPGGPATNSTFAPSGSGNTSSASDGTPGGVRSPGPAAPPAPLFDISGPKSVNAGDTTEYRLVRHDALGGPEPSKPDSALWNVSPPGYAKIDANSGKLQALPTGAGRTVKIRADYTSGDLGRSEMEVEILPAIVVYVHGYLGAADSWWGTGLPSATEAITIHPELPWWIGDSPGGRLRETVEPGKDCVVEFNDGATMKVPGTPETRGLHLNEYGQELACALNSIHAANPERKIIIVTHSAGGLAARAALTRYRPERTLLTKPHLDDLVVGPKPLGKGYVALDVAAEAAISAVVFVETPQRGFAISADVPRYMDFGISGVLRDDMREGMQPESPNQSQLSALNRLSLPSAVQFVSLANPRDQIVPPNYQWLPDRLATRYGIHSLKPWGAVRASFGELRIQGPPLLEFGHTLSSLSPEAIESLRTVRDGLRDGKAWPQIEAELAEPTTPPPPGPGLVR